MVHVNRKTSPPTVEGKKNTNGEINEWLIKSFGKQIAGKWTQTFQTSLRNYARLASITSGYLSFLHTISIL